MTGSQRIALNTLATFARSVFGMALGLFSSRWVLQALGPIDFGLMGVVGALITFVAFLNSLSAVGVSRFLAFSIGQGDPDETNKWFNTALSVHSIVPVCLVMIGYPIGLWAIRRFLNIPPDRLATACWVFRFSLVNTLIGMMATPYLGMYTAKQHIAELSLWGVVSTVSNFLFAFFLIRYRGDAWLVYGGGLVILSVLICGGQVLRARRLFPECAVRLDRWWNRRRLREMLSFSGWNLFGGLGWMFRSQGVAILLNKYFPPLAFPHVNAAYGIANQVAGQTQTLSGAMLGAFTPEIVALEGRGDRTQVHTQMLRASKLSTYLTLLFALPIWLEIDFLLNLWLKQPPVLATEFCRLMLAVFVLSRLTAGFGAAISATGRIAGYQVSLGGLAILTLPVIWLLFRAGAGPLVLCHVLFGFMVLCVAGEVFWGRILLGLSASRWLRSVALPCAACAALAFLPGRLAQVLLEPVAAGVRFLVVGGLVAGLTLAGGVVVLDRRERDGLWRQVKRCWARVPGR